MLHLSIKIRKSTRLKEIVFCWNNCSGYSQEKCFKCNLVFPKLSRLKKGQQVKGFWSQGRKKGTEGKVFEAKAVGWGWEMFPEVPFFLSRLQNVYELPFFFQPRCLGINQITRESFSPQSWSQNNYFNRMFFGFSGVFVDFLATS